MKNSCDKLKWSFVQQTLEMKGFLMSGLIHYFFQRKCAIKVNDEVDRYFQTEKGLG
jgi:hypothetical protein